MDIKFGALINVTGTYTGTSSLGNTVMLTLSVKGKPATITLTKEEAAKMAAGLSAVCK